MIKAAEKLLAEAIRLVAGLYLDGVLAKPEEYAFAFPDLLTFHDAPAPIEQKLFVMHLEHRMRTFQGTFHANPDCALWYGWSEMQRDLPRSSTWPTRCAASTGRRAGGSEESMGRQVGLDTRVHSTRARFNRRPPRIDAASPKTKPSGCESRSLRRSPCGPNMYCYPSARPDPSR